MQPTRPLEVPMFAGAFNNALFGNGDDDDHGEDDGCDDYDDDDHCDNYDNCDDDGDDEEV